MKDPTTPLNFVATVFAAVAAWFIYIGFSTETALSLPLLTLQANNLLIGIGAAIVSAILYATAAIISAIQKP